MRAAALAVLPLVGCMAAAPKPAPVVGTVPASIAASLSVTAGDVALGSADDAPTKGTKALALSDVVTMAWKDSARVLVARDQLEVSKASAHRVGREALPTADAGVGLRYFAGRQQANFGNTGDAAYPRFDPTVALRYRVNPLAAQRRQTAAERTQDVAAANIAEARRMAVREAALAYYDLVMARATMDVASQLVADGQRFFEIADARARSGIASEADVALAEAELSVARRAQIQARGQWRVASADLGTLLLLPAGVTLVPADASVAPRGWVDASADQLAAEAEQARPDLEVARRRIVAAQEAHKAHRFEIIAPDVHLEARGYVLTDFASIGPGTVLTGLVGWSISFGEFGRLREAKARTDLTKTELRVAQRQATGQVHAAVARVDASKELIAASREGLVAAGRHQQIQIARFEAGTALGVQVIQAQNNVARARLELATSVIRHNADQVELLAAIGHLDPTTVNRMSAPVGAPMPNTAATPVVVVPEPEPEPEPATAVEAEPKSNEDRPEPAAPQPVPPQPVPPQPVPPG